MAVAARQPQVSDFGEGHVYEQQYKNWLTRDDPNRSPQITSGVILRSDLNTAIKVKTGR